MKKILVVGDSHSGLFGTRGEWVDKNLKNIFDSVSMNSQTLRFCSKSFRTFWSNFPFVSNYTDVIIALGEIDIRCHVFKGDNISLLDEICNDLPDFLNYPKILNPNINVHFLSVIPPINKDKCLGPSPGFPFTGTDEERSMATELFNSKIEEVCKNNNVGFVNIYEYYIDENKMLDFSKSDTLVHCIKNEQFEEYIKKYFDL